MSVRAWGAWGVLVYCNQYLQVPMVYWKNTP